MEPRRQVGLQLFSLRTEMDSDPKATLARVAALGVSGVELAGTHGVEPAEFATLVAEAGLVPVGAMVGLEADGLSTVTLEWATRLGLPRLVVNGWVDDFASRDAVERFADRFERASAAASAVGITLLYHNHYWEFGGGVGRSSLRDLVESSPACLLELDIYWVAAACPDWRSAVEALADRVRVVHVKDGSGELPAAGWAPLPSSPAGEGAVDVEAMLAALPAAEWHVIEFDAFDGDPFEQIGRSCAFLLGAGAAST